MLLRVHVDDDASLVYPEISSTSARLHANQHLPKTAINCQRSIIPLPHQFLLPISVRRGCCHARRSSAHTIPSAQDISTLFLLLLRVAGNISDADHEFSPPHRTQPTFHAHIDARSHESDSASRALFPASRQSTTSSQAPWSVVSHHLYKLIVQI